MGKRKDDRVWQPLVRAYDHRPHPDVVRMAQSDLDVARALKDSLLDEVWVNHTYVVRVRRGEDGDVQRLSIRRQDRRPANDWRDLQAIKNQLAGEEVEAINLHPAQSRVVDTANQTWLWCCKPGVVLPLGFPRGVILDADDNSIPGAVQRPLRKG